ncbi:uncharacterized protein TNIN_252751 [Trichonephila inaurata madagascariensis]|uniref:Uncharacterized protein n=1 Tax=Trichonephila inaurata madagascariensis TaxID=2747483 RepID=A0A8X7CFH2_9ARAC|nr:uncharacterized protein TNIN_252751 [Trichonephila inaurata madagascariensis]
MEDTHTNDVIPSEEYNHILEQAMTEALPTSNNDNSEHHNWSEKQDKRLTDTVDQYSFEENTTSQLLSEKKQKKVILRIGTSTEVFDSLPKLESHYCRKDSSKLYLEPLWTSKSQLYNAYKDDFCPPEKAEPLSITSFCNILKTLICHCFGQKKIYVMSVNDKASNNEVFATDLQSVLLSLRSNVSALYYKTKLIVHNFTLYNIRKNKGYCYIWNECEGKLTSNEFSTIILTALGKFINQNPIGDDQELILYSDGCTYQNRNEVFSNALLNFSMQNKITITQKFLEKGHKLMECDSMHSVIERALETHKKLMFQQTMHIWTKRLARNSLRSRVSLSPLLQRFSDSIAFYKSIRPGKRYRAGAKGGKPPPGTANWL